MTGTATSRAAPLGFAALALVVSGCGTTAAPRSSGGSPPTTTIAQVDRHAGSREFSWLAPAPAPRGWRLARIATGAVMAYPPGWRPIRGDRGTASAALADPRHRYLGYLNLTPRQGDESASGWAAFRVAHNAAEGDRNLITLAAARGLRFRNGSGSCVRDSYSTVSNARFIELACLVIGPGGGSVIVGAAPPREWDRVSRQIERAISALVT